MRQMTMNDRWALMVGATAGCVLAFLALSTPALADGSGCNCTETGTCTFSTCCYDDGFCMLDGRSSSGSLCRVTKDANGQYVECVIGDTCLTDRSCNRAD